MGAYSVPEHIRAMKPRGTMVKAISGHYYVYEYRSVTEDGRRRTRMGRCVGKIEGGRGYVPNSGRASGSEVTTLEFGDWAVALSASVYCGRASGRPYCAEIGRASCRERV